MIFYTKYKLAYYLINILWIQYLFWKKKKKSTLRRHIKLIKMFKVDVQFFLFNFKSNDVLFIQDETCKI